MDYTSKEESLDQILNCIKEKNKHVFETIRQDSAWGASIIGVINTTSRCRHLSFRTSVKELQLLHTGGPTLSVSSSSLSTYAALISLQATVQSCRIWASEAGFPRFLMSLHTCNKLKGNPCLITLGPCYPEVLEHRHLSEIRGPWLWILLFWWIKMKCCPWVIGSPEREMWEFTFSFTNANQRWSEQLKPCVACKAGEREWQHFFTAVQRRKG